MRSRSRGVGCGSLGGSREGGEGFQWGGLQSGVGGVGLVGGGITYRIEVRSLPDICPKVFQVGPKVTHVVHGGEVTLVWSAWRLARLPLPLRTRFSTFRLAKR